MSFAFSWELSSELGFHSLQLQLAPRLVCTLQCHIQLWTTTQFPCSGFSHLHQLWLLKELIQIPAQPTELWTAACHQNYPVYWHLLQPPGEYAGTEASSYRLQYAEVFLLCCLPCLYPLLPEVAQCTALQVYLVPLLCHCHHQSRWSLLAHVQWWSTARELLFFYAVSFQIILHNKHMAGLSQVDLHQHLCSQVGVQCPQSLAWWPVVMLCSLLCPCNSHCIQSWEAQLFRCIRCRPQPELTHHHGPLGLSQHCIHWICLPFWTCSRKV